MKKKILLSSVTAAAVTLHAQDLGTIEVSGKINTKVVDSINTKEVKNADLAEALDKKSPSISLIRRSGIANDIILRGQKRDNIRVTIDDALICGACPNRMDPPTSHVITSNVEYVEIKEGPFDVTEFGNLSGGIKINTAKPTKELSGEIGATIGSYGYKKGVVSVSGGDDTVQALITYSHEKSDQYKDGSGNTLAEQTYNAVVGTAAAGTQYAPQYKDMEAYEKKSLMTKAIVNINDNNEIELGATFNRSDDILYPSSKMDAIKDDSNLYTLRYTGQKLGDFSKKLQIKTYKTDVDHPMGINYRMTNNNAMMAGMTNHLTTDTFGFKVLNSFDALDREFTIGLDTNSRNWDGKYYKDSNPFIGYSIQDTDTRNNALILQCKNQLTKDLTLEVGLRYDSTEITNGGSLQDNDYNNLNGNILTTYQVNDNAQFFLGFGQSSRVPDARELYNLASDGSIVGTPTLNEVKNKEIDFGAEYKYSSGKIKWKMFYSDLEDYIYYRKTMAANRFENIDATIYGIELSGAYYINDQFTLDAGYTWKKGQKDDPLAGQTDKDLADITPAKLTLALTYNHDDNTFFTTEFVNVASWNDYDSDNGEQKIDGYNIVNLKAQTLFAKNFELTVGVDNLFDQTYAVSNTYADLILLTDGTTNDVMLLNEPGRYMYASLKYKF